MTEPTKIQPCEICGKTDPPDEDDKYNDVYSPARPGSKAAELGLEQERLCGRCSCAQFLGSYWNGMPSEQREHGGTTPIEKYLVCERTVYVKRDDLWMGGKYAGGNAKLRGAAVHLRALKEEGVEHVGVLDARVSRGGWGISQLCKEIGLECTDFFPVLADEWDNVNRGIYPYNQQQCYKYGAHLHPLVAAKVSIMYFRARSYCQGHHIHLVPMGLMFPEAMLSVAGEATAMPRELMTGSFVVCVGTGMMFSGILLGLQAHAPKRIVAVNVGMTQMELMGESKTNVEMRVSNRIHRILPSAYKPPPFEVARADRVFYANDNFPAPFKCDEWYDRKAWRWLNEHLDELPDPVVFWNIG